MANAIDAFFISLGVEPKGVTEGMNKVESTIQNSFKNIASFIAPILGAVGFGAITKDYLAVADAMGKFSDSVGENIEDVHAWGEAVTRAGGNVDSFQASLAALGEKVAEYATLDSGEAKNIFEQWGIKAKDAEGNIKKTTDILLELSEKTQELSKAEFVGLARKLGIDQGTIMLLQSGKGAVEDLIRRQKELGVYTKEDALIAAKANDAISDLGQAFKAMTAIFLRVAVPALQVFVEILTKVVVWIKENQTFTLAFIGLLAAAITAKLLPVLAKLAIAGFRAILPWTPLIAILGALALVIDDLITYINGGESSLESFWSLFGTGEEISANLSKALQFLKDVFQQFKGTIIALTAAFVGLKIAMQFFSLGNPIVAAIMGIAAAIGIAIDNIDLLKEKFYQFVGWAKDLWGTVKGWFGFGDDKNQGVENAANNLKPLDSTLSISSEVRNRPNNINNDTQLNISTLTINTQATDSTEIASDINSALSKELSRGLAIGSNTGVAQK